MTKLVHGRHHIAPMVEESRTLPTRKLWCNISRTFRCLALKFSNVNESALISSGLTNALLAEVLPCPSSVDLQTGITPPTSTIVKPPNFVP
mmetsp:Transcript_1018/g.2167  ORF Transcript_1018/g.2167 Transcript_1018/m.2167 type:complete len:91 (-) Transcript_1018:966-1238(-)